MTQTKHTNVKMAALALDLQAERDRLREINRGLRQNNLELVGVLKRALNATNPNTDPDYDWIGEANAAIATCSDEGTKAEGKE